MIEIGRNFENCNFPLPPKNEEAMLYAFEHTLFEKYVELILKNDCPNKLNHLLK